MADFQTGLEGKPWYMGAVAGLVMAAVVYGGVHYWSLKNQRTAPAVPIADILCRVGISVCVIVTASACKGVLLAIPKGTAQTSP